MLTILKKLAKIYVSIFRGTPTTVQLLIIYFVIFAFYSGNPLFIAMLAFGMNSGAYVSEILRGGIHSVPTGQMEAGRSLGLSYSTVMTKIIFPQAIKNALPSLGNECITLLKETSIVGFIGAVDLTLAFRKIANATYDYQTVYLVMGVAYFIIVLLITIALKKLEERLMRYVKG
ncbi:MAG: amino acid ABC transporter permease [Anaeroplasmataceae bacterium]|nr:amino acid ABC transporter permease [Anaeroplasmataceae bacterium]